MARKKLKEVEDFSDLNSGTERDENLKKSRRNRAAKTFHDGDTSTDEQSDEASIISDLPNIPENPKTSRITKSYKEAKVSRTGKSIIKNFFKYLIHYRQFLISYYLSNYIGKLIL